jgi:hypothetical protein
VLDGVHINVYSECIYEEARVGALLSLA